MTTLDQKTALEQQDETPRWMRELERLSAYRTQIYLIGNVKDLVLYPLSAHNGVGVDWALCPLRDALFQFFRHQAREYDIVASYNLVDGMVFADTHDVNAMFRLYDEVIQKSGKNLHAQAPGQSPQPLKADDPLCQVLQQMYLCLKNREHSCVFIVEHASQLLTMPTHLSLDERLTFLRVLKAASEGQMVGVGEPPDRRLLQNLLILICEKLTDLPAWLYLNNPFSGTIEVEDSQKL